MFNLCLLLDIKVVLKYPYSREIDEEHLYTELQHHAATNMIDLNDSDTDTSVESDEETEETGWAACDTLHRLPYTTPVSEEQYTVSENAHSNGSHGKGILATVSKLFMATVSVVSILTLSLTME